MKKNISYRKRILGNKDKKKIKKIKQYLRGGALAERGKQIGEDANAMVKNANAMVNNAAGNIEDKVKQSPDALLDAAKKSGVNTNIPGNMDINDIKDAENVAKRAEGLKAEWQVELSKPKIQLLAEFALFSMYTVAGAFIYYPSFLVNFPNATLESIIPTEGGCKTLLGSEMLCKRKIKCFFKKCSILDDPDGEKLYREHVKKTRKNNEIKKRMLKGGSKKNKTHKKNNYSYMKYIPKTVQRQIKKNNKRDVKQFIRLYKSVLRDKSQKGGGLSSMFKKNSKEIETGGATGLPGGANGLPEGAEKLPGGANGLPEGAEKLHEGLEGTGGEMNKNQKMAQSAIKMGSKIANALKVDMGKDNVDQESCANKGNNLLCEPSKKIDYNEGKGSNFMSLFFGSTPEEYQNKAAEKIIKYLRSLLKATKRPDPQTGGSKRRKKYRRKYLKQMGGSNASVNQSANNLLNYLTNKYEEKNNTQNNNLSNFMENKYDNKPQQTSNSTTNQERTETTETNNQETNGSNGNNESLQISNNGTIKESGSIDHELLEEFMKEYFDADSIFKTLISYKMLKKLFVKDVSRKEIEEYNPNNEIFGVDVTFPWTTKEPFMTPNDRRKCLLTHLTKTNIGDNYESNDLYEKCFICKNCTLANTSFQVWERLFSTLFQDGKGQLKKVANDLYKILKTTFQFALPKVKQFYLLNLFAMNLIHPEMDINELKIQYNSSLGNYSIKDLILGIPHIKTPEFQPDGPIREKLREIYVIMEVLDIEQVLYKVAFKHIYKKVIDSYEKEERLFYIKKCILDRFVLFFGKAKLFEITDNEIDIDELNNCSMFGSSKALKQFEKNIESYTTNQINNLMNQTLQGELYQSLFTTLLDINKFDKLEKYSGTLAPIKPIIEKLNKIEFTEIDPDNHNNNN